MRNEAWDAWIARGRSTDIAAFVTGRGGLGLKRVGAELVGPCPTCGGDDRFAISPKKGVFHCRGCGAKGDVIALAQFLDGVDFAHAVETLTGEPPPEPKRKPGNGHDPKAGKLVETYPYTDEVGELRFEVCRYEPKAFNQRRPDGRGGWIWNLDGVRLVPYRLSRLIEAIANGQTVVTVEGERDVHTAESLGLVATCNPMGAGKWRAEYDPFFTGADVVIIPDNDPQTRNKKGELLFHADGRPRFVGLDHALAHV